MDETKKTELSKFLHKFSDDVLDKWVKKLMDDIPEYLEDAYDMCSQFSLLGNEVESTLKSTYEYSDKLADYKRSSILLKELLKERSRRKKVESKAPKKSNFIAKFRANRKLSSILRKNATNPVLLAGKKFKKDLGISLLSADLSDIESEIPSYQAIESSKKELEIILENTKDQIQNHELQSIDLIKRWDQVYGEFTTLLLNARKFVQFSYYQDALSASKVVEKTEKGDIYVELNDETHKLSADKTSPGFNRASIKKLLKSFRGHLEKQRVNKMDSEKAKRISLDEILPQIDSNNNLKEEVMVDKVEEKSTPISPDSYFRYDEYVSYDQYEADFDNFCKANNLIGKERERLETVQFWPISWEEKLAIAKENTKENTNDNSVESIEEKQVPIPEPKPVSVPVPELESIQPDDVITGAAPAISEEDAAKALDTVYPKDNAIDSNQPVVFDEADVDAYLPNMAEYIPDTSKLTQPKSR